jgi:hypothetical protein
MGRIVIFLRMVTAILLLGGLGLAPTGDALTHGPGALIAESEHAHWHAERGEHHGGHGHSHHDATDHDHSMAALLPPRDGIGLPAGSDFLTSRAPLFADKTPDRPPRPPRRDFPIA